MACGGITGSECLDEYTTCDLHKTEQIIKFCNDHNAMICTLCEITGHSLCDTVSIKDKRHAQTTSPDNIIRCFQDLEHRLKRLKSKESSNKLIVLNQLQDCHDDVKKTRKKLDSQFDKLENELVESIVNVEKDLLNETDSRLKACEHYIEEIEKEIKKVHGYESTKDTDAIFVGVARSLDVIENFATVYNKLKTNTSKRYPEVLINPEIEELFLALQSIGHVVESVDLCYKLLLSQPPVPLIKKQLLSRNPSKMLDTTLNEVQTALIRSSVFLPDGRLVVSSSFPDGLLMYAADCSKQASLLTGENRFHKLAAISNDIIAGTVPESKEIHFFRTTGSYLTFERKIKTHRPCYGIAILDDKLCVTCHSGNSVLGDGEVIVMSMDGKPLVRYVKSSTFGPLFMEPTDIYVDEKNSTIDVVDPGTCKIYTITKGSRISQLTLGKRPHGICRARSKSASFVLCRDAIFNIVNNTIGKEIDVKSDSLFTVSYRPMDQALFVGGYGPEMRI